VEIAIDMTVRVVPGGKSYPNSIAIRRGPQVLAAEESLNPAGVKSPGDGTVSLQTAAPPEGWNGNQVYTAGGVTLVPFSDAAVMKVWIPSR
jgi:hypothetical protein